MLRVVVAAVVVAALSEPAGSPVPGVTTTLVPTTTLEPVAVEEASVAEAAVGARVARMNALVNRDDPQAIAALDGFYVAGHPARREIDDRIATMRHEALTVIPNGDVADRLTV